MGLTAEIIQRLAEHLERCQLEVRDTVKITDEHPEMDWDDAYAIQEVILQRKLARGAKLIGYKAGLTSRAKMLQMGVTEPVFGFLLEEYCVSDGTSLATDRLIHPKVEPEIVFVLGRDLSGPGCHIGSVLAATAFVLSGIEVIDSRYRDFKFDLKSVVADNTSAAYFVLGGVAAAPKAVDLRSCGIVLEKNGQPVAFGAGAAVLGHPAAAVAALVNHLARQGKFLPAGSIVLSGGITEAVAVGRGDAVRLRVQGMGQVSLRFE